MTLQELSDSDSCIEVSEDDRDNIVFNLVGVSRGVR